MIDLYSEILKSNEMNKSISDFTEEIVEDPTVRDNFLIEFVDEIMDSMSPEDIKDAFDESYAQSLLSQLHDELDQNREEYIVQECIECFPHVLERFGVNLDENNASS